jgi:hypothetical protein
LPIASWPAWQPQVALSGVLCLPFLLRSAPWSLFYGLFSSCAGLDFTKWKPYKYIFLHIHICMHNIYMCIYTYEILSFLAYIRISQAFPWYLNKIEDLKIDNQDLILDIYM